MQRATPKGHAAAMVVDTEVSPKGANGGADDVAAGGAAAYTTNNHFGILAEMQDFSPYFRHVL
ncbi:MAG: hypothetical protein IPN76_26580 [Saprospiraceae bacterium]|nr:hypothetical protein [Saprospiraceae bacterium]